MKEFSSGALGVLDMAGRDVRFGSAIDRLIYLRGLGDLFNVKASELRLFAQHARERFFPAGTYLTREGRRPEAMHFIVEGHVEVSRKGVVHMTCDAPHGVGFFPLLTLNPHGVDARAVVDTLTLEIPGNLMLELVEDNFDFLLAALRGMSGQLATTQRELELRGLLTRSEVLEGPYPKDPLDIVQRLTRLRKGPYASANLEALIEMARQLEEIRVGPGEVLWREGDEAPFGLTIIHGIVRCTGDDGARDFRMGSDSVIGHLEANAGRPRAYDAITETRVVALKATIETFHDILEDHQEVGLAFVSFLAEIVTELRIKSATARTG